MPTSRVFLSNGIDNGSQVFPKRTDIRDDPDQIKALEASRDVFGVSITEYNPERKTTIVFEVVTTGQEFTIDHTDWPEPQFGGDSLPFYERLATEIEQITGRSDLTVVYG